MKNLKIKLLTMSNINRMQRSFSNIPEKLTSDDICLIKYAPIMRKFVNVFPQLKIF